MDIALSTPAIPRNAAKAASVPAKPKSHLPMAMKLAYRNLFHDRISFFVTIIGIVFSVVLVAVQTGIYLGSENKIAAIIDQAPADLWVVPLGTKSYDDPSLLAGRERHMILSTPGARSAARMSSLKAKLISYFMDFNTSAVLAFDSSSSPSGFPKRSPVSDNSEVSLVPVRTKVLPSQAKNRCWSEVLSGNSTLRAAFKASMPAKLNFT